MIIKINSNKTFKHKPVPFSFIKAFQVWVTYKIIKTPSFKCVYHITIIFIKRSIYENEIKKIQKKYLQRFFWSFVNQKRKNEVKMYEK